jgi:RsiW-degrading membrane proteinase PrsW (M82 family)
VQALRRPLVLGLLLTGAVAAVHAGTGTPLVILLAALLPAVAYAALFSWIARSLQQRAHVLAATFLCGAVIAACLSAIANDLLHVWLSARLGEQQARNLTPVLGGPLIEEACKALALLALLAYLRGGFSSVVEGILHGACVGIGFAMTENVGYFTLAALQGGTAGLVRSVYLRGLIEGLNHATFTGAIGAGLGFARVATAACGRVGAPLVGFAAAVLQHVVWNFVASRAVMGALCDPQVGGACRSTPEPFALFATVPLIVTLAIGPGVIALLVIAVRTSGRVNSGT